MEWFIVSRDFHVLCVPSTDASDSLPIYDDNEQISITNNTVVSTLDFTVSQKHKDANNLKYGNYIIFKNKYDKMKMFTLMSYEGDEIERTWHAEDIGLDLLNETADKWDYSSEKHPLSWYFEKTLYDTGWTIGVNEVSNLSRGLKFEGDSDTALRRLGDIANQFDGAEIDFEIEMDGNRVVKQKVNIYKKVGTSVTQQRFIDSVNLKSLTGKGGIEDLQTALEGRGSQPDAKEGENQDDLLPVNFSSIAYDDGQFYSPKGDKILYDRVNHQIWSRYDGFDFNNPDDKHGYIKGIYPYETKDPQELLNRTITQLKKVNHPNEVYEANLLDIKADIGDYVQIAHNEFNPPIYLSARIEQVNNCYTEKGKDTGILGDYTKLEADLDPRIRDMIDDLANKIKPSDTYYPWIRYASDNSGSDFSATPTDKTKYIAWLMVKNNPVPSDDPKDYLGKWTLIKGSDGTPGQNGDDGQTSYIHYAWADDLNGTGFSLTESTAKGYFGIYSDFKQEPSTNYKDYAWTEMAGNFGNIIEDIENSMKSINRVYTQADPPLEDLTDGDQWWQIDDEGNVIGYYLYADNDWQPQTIQQSLLNIVKLNAIDITGATITGSKFANEFNYKDQTGNQFVGTTTIENGKIVSEYKLPLTNQAGKVSFEPDGYHQIVYDPQGNIQNSIDFTFGQLMLNDAMQGVNGILSAGDLDVAGPEIWKVGSETVQFDKRFRRVQLSGNMEVPVANFGTGGSGYKKLFKLENQKLWPKKTYHIQGFSLVSPWNVACTLEVRSNGDVVAIACNQQSRFSFNSASYPAS